jgi:phage tail P2-like protein
VSNTLLPPNATPQERAMEGATARLADVPVLVRESKDPTACPPVLLPWLAHQYSVDAWQSNWTDAQKRQTIRDSVFIHQHKGTIGAVRSALASLGIGVRVQEWFNKTPAGAPYTYSLLLEVDQVGFSQEQLLSVDGVVEASKNLRSHLDKMVLTVTTRSGPYVATVTGVGIDMTVGYGAPDLYLLMEGATNGMAATESAVDALHTQLHETMSNPSYW